MTWVYVSIAAGVILAAAVYVWREGMGLEGAALAALRAVAFAALFVVLFNPVTTTRGEHAPPTVLLDASLSMAAVGAHWERARDSAATLAGSNGVLLRFGESISSTDSGVPIGGASRVAEALRVAAGRIGPVVVVTDGEIDDRASIPPSLLDGVGVVPILRDAVPDAALLDVGVRQRYLEGDSIAASLTIGRWHLPGVLDATVEVFLGERRVHSEQFVVPSNAPAVRRTLTLDPNLVPAGDHVMRFTLAVDGDEEPRDNERVRVVTVSSQPGVVVIVDPADSEGRFLVRELRSIVRSGVRGYARIADDAWVDMADLTPVTEATVRRVARAASLIVSRSANPERFPGVTTWSWPAAVDGRAEFFDGDWYVTAETGPSPLAGRFAAIQWDSVPPLTGIIPVVATGSEWVALSGRLGRRGADRPLLVGRDSAGMRTLTTTSSGFWRWALRGGAALEAYRATVSAGVDWLLDETGTGAIAGIRAARATTLGRAVVFRWEGDGRPDSSVSVSMAGPDSAIVVGLTFDSENEARAYLPEGVYRWNSPAGDGTSGIAVVESYSDEFHPRPVTFAAADAGSAFDLLFRYARERWWLFALAMAALIAEWAWRQRRGLP